MHIKKDDENELNTNMHKNLCIPISLLLSLAPSSRWMFLNTFCCMVDNIVGLTFAMSGCQRSLVVWGSAARCPMIATSRLAIIIIT
jgi:hypothetical protein